MVANFEPFKTNHCVGREYQKLGFQSDSIHSAYLTLQRLVVCVCTGNSMRQVGEISISAMRDKHAIYYEGQFTAFKFCLNR